MKEKEFDKGEIHIYKTSDRRIDLKVRLEKETVWLDVYQMAKVFDIDRTGIIRHIQNIYESDELSKKSTCAKIAQVAKDRKIRRREIYNLDVIISVGYRVNSKKATDFRKWATSVLREYLTQGFVINKKQIATNYDHFLQAVESIKELSKNKELVGSDEVLDLVKTFADTWISLDAYDKEDLPKKGYNKKKIGFVMTELSESLGRFKEELAKKGEATELFAQEKNDGDFEGIVGNIFQSFDGKELYPTVESKAAHLLYFVVKNHVFNDGNKRSGAFSFIWFLQKAGILNRDRINPAALTVLTLLIAESDPKEMERMIGLVLLLLKN